MAVLTVQNVIRAGVVPVYNAAADLGDAFLNDGKVWIHVVNGAVELIITLATPMTIGGLAVDDLVVTIAANTEQVIGVFPANMFNDGAELVQLTYSKHEAVTIALWKVS